MPLTEFQMGVLRLLKQHRSPDSYVAGGAAIHRAPASLRRSRDVDFFHSTDEAVVSSAQADLTLLSRNGFSVQRLIEQPAFIRAVIAQGEQSLKLEWVRDTAFRFFPVIEDDQLGYRLHDVDLMVNKCLALANRNEVRDIVDLIQQHREVLSLPAACWAACGKDPGFTPALLLDCMRRNSIIRPEQLNAEYLERPLTAPELKMEWLALLAEAERILPDFPPAELGCLYLTPAGDIAHAPDPARLTQMVRHFGKLGGSWPRVVP